MHHDMSVYIAKKVTWPVPWRESHLMLMSLPIISDKLLRGMSRDCHMTPLSTFLSPPPLPRYMLRYQECIPCEQLVMQLCDVKQAYTQFGGDEYLGSATVFNIVIACRETSLWCIHPIHGVGPSFRLPTLSE